MFDAKVCVRLSGALESSIFTRIGKKCSIPESANDISGYASGENPLICGASTARQTVQSHVVECSHTEAAWRKNCCFCRTLLLGNCTFASPCQSTQSHRSNPISEYSQPQMMYRWLRDRPKWCQVDSAARFMIHYSSCGSACNSSERAELSALRKVPTVHISSFITFNFWKPHTIIVVIHKV